MQPERSPSILIVEDEAIVATDLQETLADMGYEPFAIAASADEALRWAAQRCPDLVLMDIRIQGDRDGIETAALLRDDFDVPIIYLTAHADDATLRRARDTEPHGYLTKPIKPADLRSAIELSLHRHQITKRLRERERWFSTTLRSISDAVITVDIAGTITFMNAAAEAMIGITAADGIGRPARDVVRLLDPAQPASPLDVVLEHKHGIFVAEAPLEHRTSRNRIITDSASPVLDDGELLGAVMVFRDITEQRRMQQQVELNDRLASLGTMAAGVAHEINNPLAVVLLNADFVLAELEARTGDGGSAAALIEAQRELKTAAARIKHIVADLTAFAQPTARAAGEADVGEAVRWALRTTATELGHRARVTADVVDCPRVQIDEHRLGQVLINLLVNAAHAIGPGAVDDNSVTILGRRSGDEVVLEVRDTGAGMAPEVVNRIFEPFYSTKGVGAGTGLGLAICHGIVSSAGGRVEVESEPGVGSTFRVRLPVAAPPPPVPTTAPATTAARRGRILVIDDEPTILKAMRRILRDHDLICLTDAREALDLLARGERFDLILSDVMMPSMTGIELYERLLADHPDVVPRVIFITGGTMNPRVADFVAVIPNLWLEKPVAVAELRDLIQRRLAALT